MGDNVSGFANACASFSFFPHSLNVVAWSRGAEDWGSNFNNAQESCKCPDPSDSSQCTPYAGTSVHKQVRTRSKFSTLILLSSSHNDSLCRHLKYSKHQGNCDMKIQQLSKYKTNLY